ncbi:transcriptional activator hap3 [Malassezia equina]|uniref:Transcriptional activator hap3 n=1 Tax=Malassezia equina TaxID=1381935 RepID=A0AAF0EGK9_9BASI|nr:transcriptional activator hap3 [Malassezia equina]
MAMPSAGTLESEARAMAPGFGSGTGAGASASPDTSKTEGLEATRGWPTSLPPLPPHMAGADLPIANISRIMKRALPENGKIAKNAKECMQECVSELISFITSEASDRCGSEKRKTINGDDILYSLRVLGFDNYEQVLKVYLSRYRQAQEENPRQRRRRASKRRSSNEGAGEGDLSTMDGAGTENDVHDDDDDNLSDDAEEDE